MKLGRGGVLSWRLNKLGRALNHNTNMKVLSCRKVIVWDKKASERSSGKEMQLSRGDPLCNPPVGALIH